MVEYHRSISDSEDLVILFSGGLDSAIAYYYAERIFSPARVRGLFVDIGQPYAEHESASVMKFMKATSANITMLNYRFIDEKTYYYERATPLKQIIPGRNMTLATIAANFGTTIWVNALKGELKESMHDKNWTFFSESSRILSYTFDNNIVVESPFWHMTKTETVSLALNELKVPEEILRNTCSCYNPSVVDGKVVFCGNCLTCFKRKVAMVNNGIEEDYLSNPFTSWYALDVYNRSKQGLLEDYVVKDYRDAYNSIGCDFEDIPNLHRKGE